jgi:hypothetical protein
MPYTVYNKLSPSSLLRIVSSLQLSQHQWQIASR